MGKKEDSRCTGSDSSTPPPRWSGEDDGFPQRPILSRKISDGKWVEKTRAEDVARVDIKKQMRDLIEDGWQKTDSYGRPDGKKVTVKDLVLEYMNAHDRYDSRGTWMQKTLQSLLTETLQKVVAPEIEAARKAFKDMLDTSIREKLTNALREAMGLKL